MLTHHLAVLFERDLLKLKNEINAYTDETKLWGTAAQISNSGGNLCLHLLGNLQFYIGAVLGGTGYVRNRPAEFSNKNIPRTEIAASIDHTSKVVRETVRSLPAEALGKEYPEKVFDQPMTVDYFLLHLLAHLNYHLGQINYHRRLQDTYQPEAGG
ncbi:MAG: DinB superfamily protein [Sediminibacterium sp.]|nr:DinB superfamily protein [Sediminibacterium sp.]